MHRSRHVLNRTVAVIILLSIFLPIKVFALPANLQSLFNRNIIKFDPEVCENVGTNSSIDRFLQVLAHGESRGNPTAKNPNSTATGKYQYIDSTWRARAALYGPSGNYSEAYLAPEEVQDAVAYIEYAQKFQSLNNDIFKLAVSHFYPIANEKPNLLDVFPPSNSITPRQYADLVVKRLGDGTGSDIALRYSEAPEFSVWLEKAGVNTAAIATGSSASGSCAQATSCGGASDLPFPKDIEPAWYNADAHNRSIGLPNNKKGHGPILNKSSNYGSEAVANSSDAGAALGEAVDLGLPYGTPIYAPFDGTVLSTALIHNDASDGYKVIIESMDKSCVAVMAHLTGITLSPTTTVKAGDQVGSLIYLGGNGITNGHLHFELWAGGVPVNIGPAKNPHDYSEEAKQIWVKQKEALGVK